MEETMRERSACNSLVHRTRNRVGILGNVVVLLSLTILPVGSVHALSLLSQATWGGADSEVAEGVATASDGSAYLGGRTRSFMVHHGSIFLVKFASDGTTLDWQRVWEGPSTFIDDVATDITAGPDGSVYVTGSTLGVGGDAILLKFDPDGTLVWQRSWGGSAFEEGEAVAVAADGSVYVVGGTSSFGSGSSNLFVLKFAADGTLVWQKIRADVSGDAVAVGPDGSLYVAGSALRPGTVSDFDLVVLKLAPDGSLVWQREYAAGNVVDARGGMKVAIDGSVYVVGGFQAPKMGLFDLDALIVKLAPDGGLVWDRSWGGRSGDDAEGVALAADGTVFIGGITNSFGSGNDDAFVLELLPSGKVTDAITWGGTGLDNGMGIGLAGDGSLRLAVTVEPPPYFFLKAPMKIVKPRGTLTTPAGSLLDGGGTVSDPGGVVSVPNGSLTFAGSFDAALVRIAP